MVLSQRRSLQHNVAPMANLDEEGRGKNLSANSRSGKFPGKESSAKTKISVLAPKMFTGRPETAVRGDRPPLKPFFNVVRSTKTSSMENDALFERWKRRQKNVRNSSIRLDCKLLNFPICRALISLNFAFLYSYGLTIYIFWQPFSVPGLVEYFLNITTLSLTCELDKIRFLNHCSSTLNNQKPN